MSVPPLCVLVPVMTAILFAVLIIWPAPDTLLAKLTPPIPRIAFCKTTTFPVPRPRPLFSPTRPELITVPPVKLLALFMTRSPVPFFVNAPAPLITVLLTSVVLLSNTSCVSAAVVTGPPPNAAAVFTMTRPPIISTPPVRLLLSKVRSPTSDLRKMPAPVTDWLSVCCPAMERSNAAPAWTVMAPVPRKLISVTRMAPCWISVPPLYVFAPIKDTVPLPVFTMRPKPVTSFDKVVNAAVERSRTLVAPVRSILAVLPTFWLPSICSVPLLTKTMPDKLLLLPVRVKRFELASSRSPAPVSDAAITVSTPALLTVT